MLNTLFGFKKGMGQTYVEGTKVPYTVVKVSPLVVTQIKTTDKDGYNAVQLAFGEKRIKNIRKPQKIHFEKTLKDTNLFSPKFAPRYQKEVRTDEAESFNTGSVIKLSDVFKKGDLITVSGRSKGKGFAGVVKRWHFAGGPRTHGQSDRERAPGSIGQGTTPGRVLKGKKMAGRMGDERKTIKNLIIVNIDNENDELWLSGPIPGKTGGIITLTKTASGKLDELVEETPVAEVVQGEETEKGGVSEEKSEI